MDDENDITLIEILEILISMTPEEKDIQMASTTLTNKMRIDPINTVIELSYIIEENIENTQLVFASIVNISNALSTRVNTIGRLRKLWNNLDIETRESLRNVLLTLMSNEDMKIRYNAAYCIAMEVFIEYPIQLWNDFFESIFQIVLNTSNGVSLISSCLNCLNQLLVFNFFDPEMVFFNDIVSSIYSSAMFHLDQLETPDDVRIQAIGCLINSHLFLDPILKESNNLKTFFDMIIRNFSIVNQDFHDLIYELLLKSCVRHIRMLEPVFYDVFQTTAIDFLSGEEKNKSNSIGLWTAIAGAEADNHVHMGVLNSAHIFVPSLISNLEKMVDEDDEDDLALINESIVCLTCFVNAEPELMMPMIIKYIEDNISSDEIVKVNSALLSFYSILDSPQAFSFLQSLINNIITIAAKATNMILQGSAMLIISRGISQFPSLIASQNEFDLLISLCELNVSKPAKLAKRSYQLLYDLYSVFNSDQMQEFLGNCFERIWDIFCVGFSHQDYRDQFFFRNLYESLNEFIIHLPKSCEIQMENILELVLNMINEEMFNQFANYIQITSYLCSVVSSLSFKLMSSINNYASKIVDVLIPLFSYLDSQLYAEIIIVLDNLSIILKNQFNSFIETQDQVELIIEPIAVACESLDPTIVYSSSRFLGDLFRYATSNLTNVYQPRFFKILTDSLKSNFPRDMYPNIIKSLSTITRYAQSEKEKCVLKLLMVMNDFHKIPIDVSQPDDVEFVTGLYESMIHVSITVAKIGEPEVVERNMNMLLKNIQKIWTLSVMNGNILKETLCLLDILSTNYKTLFMDTISLEENSCAYQFVNLVLQSDDEDLKSIAGSIYLIMLQA